MSGWIMYKNFFYFVDLVGMKVSPSELTDADDTTNLTMGCTKSDATDGSKDVAQNTVPMPVATAVDACACTTASCSIQWKYY